MKTLFVQCWPGIGLYFVVYAKEPSLFTHTPSNPTTSEVLSMIINNELTLESGIDVGQVINVGPGKLDKNNKRRALNKRRAWKI